jgi:hypothetical protein
MDKSLASSEKTARTSVRRVTAFITGAMALSLGYASVAQAQYTGPFIASQPQSLETSVRYRFSDATCQTKVLPSQRSSDGTELGLTYIMTDMNGPAYSPTPSVSALSWVYELSGACTPHAVSAYRETVALDNQQVLLASVNQLTLYDPDVMPELASDVLVPSPVPNETLLFVQSKFRMVFSLSKTTEGTFWVRLTTTLGKTHDLIRSRLPLRSVTYFPGIHGDGGQVSLLQEQPDATLRIVVLDIRHP